MLVKLPKYKVIDACDKFIDEIGYSPEHIPPNVNELVFISPHADVLVFRNILLKVKTQYVYLEKSDIIMLGDFIEWEE